MQTYIVYILMVITVLCLAKNAQVRNKRSRFMFVAVLLSVIAGLRAESVGVDTANYVRLFGLIGQGEFKLAYGLETSFKYICAFLLTIWDHPNFLFLVFAVVTNCFIFARLWDFRDRISLTWATVIYIAVFYFMTFNVLRQFVAVAILFYATKYLERKKYFKFLICVMCATLFHTSALLGLLFIVFDIFDWSQLTKKQKKIIKIFIVCGVAAVAVLGIGIIGKYSSYFTNVHFNFGILILLKILLFALTARSMSGEYVANAEGGYSVEAYSFKTVKVYYFVGMLLTALGYMFDNMNRVGLYFYLFETVYIGMVMCSKRVSVITKLIISALYLFLMFGTVFGNGQGQGNYLFFWQV